MTSEELMQTIASAYKTNKLNHAMLLECENQNELAKTLDWIAGTLFCTATSNCGECSQCIKFKNNALLSYKKLGNGTDNIKKSDVHDLITWLSHTSVEESDFRIYTIQNAENMTSEAANALLKTLEEPPLHVLAFIATKDRHEHEVLPTIRSRCQLQVLDDKVVVLAENKLVDIMVTHNKEQLFLYGAELKKMKKDEVLTIMQDCFQKIIVQDFTSLAPIFLETIYQIKKWYSYQLAIENLLINIFEVL